jgi:hypothetical protein
MPDWAWATPANQKHSKQAAENDLTIIRNLRRMMGMAHIHTDSVAAAWPQRGAQTAVSEPVPRPGTPKGQPATIPNFV